MKHEVRCFAVAEVNRKVMRMRTRDGLNRKSSLLLFAYGPTDRIYNDGPLADVCDAETEVLLKGSAIPDYQIA